MLACVTYNLGIFPPMHDFLMDMKALNVQNRTIAVMENGSWAIRSGALMREFLEGMKRMKILDEGVVMASSLGEQNMADLGALRVDIAAELRSEPA